MDFPIETGGKRRSAHKATDSGKPIVLLLKILAEEEL